MEAQKHSTAKGTSLVLHHRTMVSLYDQPTAVTLDQWKTEHNFWDAKVLSGDQKSDQEVYSLVNTPYF